MSRANNDKNKKIAAFYYNMTVAEAKQLGMNVRGKSAFSDNGYRFMFTDKPRHIYQTDTQHAIKKHLEFFTTGRDDETYLPEGFKQFHKLLLKGDTYAKAFAAFDESTIFNQLILTKQYEILFPGDWGSYVELLLTKYLSGVVFDLVRKNSNCFSVAIDDYDDRLMSSSDIEFFIAAETSDDNLEKTLLVYKKICERSFKIVLGLLKTSREELLSSLMRDQVRDDDYHSNSDDNIDFTRHIAAVVEPKYMALLLVDSNPNTRAFAKMHLETSIKAKG